MQKESKLIKSDIYVYHGKHAFLLYLLNLLQACENNFVSSVFYYFLSCISFRSLNGLGGLHQRLHAIDMRLCVCELVLVSNLFLVSYLKLD